MNDALERSSATVRLTVTIVNDGEPAVSREFVAETAGNARSTRAAYGACNSLVRDAERWIESLKPARKLPRPVQYSPVPVNGWQRFLLALANLPTPTRMTVARPEPAGPATEGNGPAGGVVHTAAASIWVDSAEVTDTVSVAGNTSGSPYQLAEDLTHTVVFDLRERLASLRYDLESAR